METIHPLKLEALLEASRPVEIVDIRPRTEFEKVEGANCLAQLRAVRYREAVVDLSRLG